MGGLYEGMQRGFVLFNVFISQTIQLTTAEENCSPIANTSPFKGLQ
jgi:hypothetical protein